MTAPHGHWRLVGEIKHLARGHDRAGMALGRYAAAAGRPAPGPFPWWAIPAVLGTAFLGWTSAEALQAITGEALPVPIALLPGLALAVALTGMTVVTATALRGSGRRSAALWPGALAGVCAIGAIVWVALWMESTVRTARPVAFAAGVLLVLGVTAAAFGAVLYGGPRRRHRVPAERSRRARLRRRIAEKAIRSHERTWTRVAHQTSALLTDAPEGRALLLRLIDGGSPPTIPDGLNPVHALVLAALRDHRPHDLLAGLDTIDKGPEGAERAQSMDGDSGLELQRLPRQR